MKILVIGSGGREHALCWKIKQSKLCKTIYCAPGNAGTSEIAENIPINATEKKKLLKFALKEKIDLTIVGPETSLEKGIVDLFEKNNLKIFGPTKNATRIESNKAFAKKLMLEAKIPTAEFKTFTDSKKAIEYVKTKNKIVIKASGLAAGKGVIICDNSKEAIKTIKEVMIEKKFGDAGNKIVIEEFLEGEEASFLVFTDGKTAKPMVTSQDHKQVFDGDKGPNTGGMGAYSPAPVINKKLEKKIMQQVINPLLKKMSEKKTLFKGVLYAGLMIKNNEVKVIEFNARFGDPETQVILPRLKTDLVKIMLASIKEKLAKTRISWSKKASCCVVLTSKGYPKKYEKGKQVKGLEKVKQLKNTLLFHAGTRKENEKILTNGGRVLNVIGLGETIKQAIKTSYNAVEKISFNGMHYRKDIGLKALKRIQKQEK